MYIASQLVYTIYIFHYMSADFKKKYICFSNLEKILNEVQILAHIIIDTTHLFTQCVAGEYTLHPPSHYLFIFVIYF